MFSEIPKLFGRDFAIAYFIPSAILLVSITTVMSTFDVKFILNDVLSEKLLGVAVYIFVTWVFSIVLMAINSQLIRFLEGYGPLNPLRFRKSRMRRLFRETAFPALEEAKIVDLAREQDRPVLPDLGLQLGKRLRVVVSEFPHEEEWVLATKMGNSIRAFEVYSRVVYGLDAITAWPRLSMIQHD